MNRLSTPTAKTRNGTTSRIINDASTFKKLMNPNEAPTAINTINTPKKPRHTFRSICMQVCMYICMCVCVCMYVRTYLCIYVWMYQGWEKVLQPMQIRATLIKTCVNLCSFLQTKLQRLFSNRCPSPSIYMYIMYVCM